MKRIDSSVESRAKAQAKSLPSLTQRAYLTAISSLLDYVARVAVSFVLTPYLVSGLGSALFGIWQILTRLVSYLTAVDGRPTQALKWIIATDQRSDDYAAKRKAIGSALAVWLLLSPALIAVGSVLVWLAPVVTNAPSELETSIRVTCALLVINLILSVLVSVPDSVLRGMNLGYKRMGLMASLNILGGILTASAIFFGWGLVGIAAAQVFLTIITGVLVWYLVRVYVPWFGAAAVSLREIRFFFGVSIWYSAGSLVYALLLASDVVVLGWILSPFAVTQYVLTGYAASTMAAIVTMIIGAIVPGLGGVISTGNRVRVIETRNEMAWMSYLFCAVLGSSILMWNHSFVTLWVGENQYAGPWVNLLSVLTAFQLILIRNEVFMIDLTLNVRRKVIYGFVAALLSVALAVPLIRLLGIVGLCIAVLIGRGVLTITYPVLTANYLRVEALTQVKVVIRPFLVMMSLFVASAYLGQKVWASSWFILFIYVCLCLPIVLLAYFVVGFPRHQRDRLLERARQLRPFVLRG
jgi:O-antigen/teichoic acid export membrane protein